MSEGGGSFETARAAARAEAPVLGVVEGFYGRPWSWAARHRMVDFLAPLGFGMYVYAPKDEPLHRLQWRERYFPEELRRFARLARRCRRLGVELVYGLHPIDLEPAPADLERLHAKARQLQGVGVGSFCLLFDDLPGGAGQGERQRRASARRHAAVARALSERLGSSGPFVRLQLVPTEYHGLRRPSPYLRTLGAELAPDIDVYWTGREVCSRTIEAADVEQLTASLGRRPLIWDNYPVNDTEMGAELHIRPFRGRAPELASLARGVVANPANQAEASRIALHTLAAWWRDPAGYEAERAWDEALLAVTGRPADADALRLLGELAGRSPLEDARPIAVLERLRSALAVGMPPTALDVEAGNVSAEAARWRSAAAWLLRESADRRLARDVAPWCRKLSAWSDAVDAALATLAADEAALPAARRVGLARLDAARRQGPWVADEQVDTFCRALLWSTAAGGAGQAPSEIEEAAA